MVRRLGLGKNNHLTYDSLALNPRHVDSDVISYLGIADLGPLVQSIVSLTSLLVIKMLSVLVSTISISQVCLLKKM